MYELRILTPILDELEECLHHRLRRISNRIPDGATCHATVDRISRNKLRVRFEVRAPEGFYLGEAQAEDGRRAMDLAEAQLSAELARGPKLFEEDADSLGVRSKVADSYS